MTNLSLFSRSTYICGGPYLLTILFLYIRFYWLYKPLGFLFALRASFCCIGVPHLWNKRFQICIILVYLGFNGFSNLALVSLPIFSHLFLSANGPLSNLLSPLLVVSNNRVTSSFFLLFVLAVALTVRATRA